MNRYMQIHTKWSEAELASLKEDYGVLLPEALEQKYGRKYSVIRSAAARYGIKSKRYTGKKRLWTKEEENALTYDWENTKLTAKDLAEKYNRSLESIRNKVKELRLQKKQLFISEEQEKEIMHLYGSIKSNGAKMGAHSIAKVLGKSSSAIRNIVKKNGGKMLKYGDANRQFSVNTSYFMNGVKTHDSAYILGLYYADGYNDEERGAIGITLKASDAILLQEVSAVIGGNRPVKFYKHKYKDKYREYANLYIKNKDISQDMAKLGVVQNKSLIAQPPDIGDDMFMSFLRGVSDGDGCIALRADRRHIYWGICGAAKDFINWILMKLKIMFPLINFSWEEDMRKNNTLYCIKINSTESTIIFLNELYRDVWQNDSKLFLPRKYEKVREWKKERKAYEYGNLPRTLQERAKILHRQAGLGILQ